MAAVKLSSQRQASMSTRCYQQQTSTFCKGQNVQSSCFTRLRLPTHDRQVYIQTSSHNKTFITPHRRSWRIMEEKDQLFFLSTTKSQDSSSDPDIQNRRSPTLNHWEEFESFTCFKKDYFLKSSFHSRPQKFGKPNFKNQSQGIHQNSEDEDPSSIANPASIRICSFCYQSHWNSKCPTLSTLTPIQRQKLVEEKKLCKNCLIDFSHAQNHQLPTSPMLCQRMQLEASHSASFQRCSIRNSDNKKIKNFHKNHPPNKRNEEIRANQAHPRRKKIPHQNKITGLYFQPKHNAFSYVSFNLI
jgi:hypothetical protein